MAEPRTAPRALFPAVLFVILAGSAVYFAGSVAAPALAARWDMTPQQAAWLTGAVQLGFVVGTLGAVALDLPDRFRPGRLLAVLLLVAAVLNGLLLVAPGGGWGLLLRFLVGVSSGPVYPIGMRLLATWFPRLGTRLGILLGAYTLGLGVTAVLKALQFPWQHAVLGSSAVAALAALVAVSGLGAGPLLPVRQTFDLQAGLRSFRSVAYRRSAVSYFGHMWELFAFWGLLPFWLLAAGWSPGATDVLVTLAFLAGAAGCVVGGWVSRRAGEAAVARAAIATSGALCLLSPWIFSAPGWIAVLAVALWAGTVVTDSPMFSALSSAAAPRTHVGAALTVQNAIGFAIPVVPLALVPWVAGLFGWQYAFVVLAAGPLLVLPLVHRLVKEPPAPRAPPGPEGAGGGPAPEEGPLRSI